jgi:hypothetical protein
MADENWYLVEAFDQAHHIARVVSNARAGETRVGIIAPAPKRESANLACGNASRARQTRARNAQSTSRRKRRQGS